MCEPVSATTATTAAVSSTAAASSAAAASAAAASTTAATAAAASTPAWLSYASLAATALGTAGSAYGMYQQGQAGKAQAEYTAAANRNNAIMAERQALDAEKRGKLLEDQQRLKVQQLLGRQRSALAGAGVDLTDGSPLDILGDTAETGEIDALTIRSNTEREAWGYRAQGANYGAQAGLDMARASSTGSAGMMGAGASLLTGAGSVADKWYTYKYGRRAA